jgi:hypothetical protein
MSPTLTLKAPVVLTAPASTGRTRTRSSCTFTSIDQHGAAVGPQRQAAAFQVQHQIKSALADCCTRPAYMAALLPPDPKRQEVIPYNALFYFPALPGFDGFINTLMALPIILSGDITVGLWRD